MDIAYTASILDASSSHVEKGTLCYAFRMSRERVAETLRSYKLRATKQRVSLLTQLLRSGTPASVETIDSSIEGELDQATLYRALQEFERVGLVRRVVRKRGSALYELVGAHHHHLMCRVCGTIEDVDLCLPKSLYAKVLQSSKRFARVEDHELEFVGMCTTCSKKRI